MVRVVAATPDDWTRSRALRLAALSDAPDAFASTFAAERDLAESAWRRRLERPFTTTLIATLAGDDIGIAVLAPTSGDPDAAGLYSVWVAPAGRGRGVGDALLRAVAACATREGRRRVVLDVAVQNTFAIALYARAGFLATGRRSTLPPPREHIEEIELALDLAPRGAP